MLYNFEMVCICPRCKAENEGIRMDQLPYYCVICAFPMINRVEDAVEMRIKLTCNVYMIIESSEKSYMVAAYDDQMALDYAMEHLGIKSFNVFMKVPESGFNRPVIIDEKLSPDNNSKVRVTLQQLVMELPALPAYVCELKELEDGTFSYWRKKDEFIIKEQK